MFKKILTIFIAMTLGIVGFVPLFCVGAADKKALSVGEVWHLITMLQVDIIF